MGIRIQLRLGSVVPRDEYLDVGEGLWDPDLNRLGFGTGNSQPLFYPGLDPINQDLIMDGGSLVRSESGGKLARFGWDGANRFSMYTFSGLRLRITDTAANFYVRTSFNAGGTLAGDFDTAGGRFTDMNIQSITVSSSSQRILIKDADTGNTVGRLDDNGITGKSLQQFYLAMAAQNEANTQLFRNLYSSGIVSVRNHNVPAAFNPKTKDSTTYMSALASHSHPDFRGMCGLGELSALVNGYHIQTRHNDYRLSRPVGTAVFGERAPNTGVPVPSAVKSRPLGYTGLALSSSQTGTQLDWMRKLYTEAPEYCVFELSYLETWIQKFDDNFLDIASSTRRFDKDRGFKKLVEWAHTYTRNGYKVPNEDLPLPAGVVATYDEFGHPVLGYVNWRISSIPVATLSNTLRQYTLDGVNHNLRALPFDEEKAIAGIVDASNRFILRRSVKERYLTSKPGVFRDEPDKLGWDDIIRSHRAMFDCADLPELCRMAPGFAGVGADALQFEDDLNGVKMTGNRNAKIRFSNESTIQGLNYYNNKYLMNQADASGLRTQTKGFADNNLFTARASHPSIIGGYTYMVPLELVLRTPRENWNPFAVPEKTVVKGTGASSAPFDGYNVNGRFYTLPSDSILPNPARPVPPALSADTGNKILYVKTPSGTKLMRASGTRVFDIDGYRQRFPIAPDATQFSAEASELAWLKHTLKPLLKKLASGTIVDDDIDEVF